MSTTTNNDDSNDEQSDWKPKYGDDTVYHATAQAMGAPSKTRVRTDAPEIEATHLPTNTVVISVQPEPYPKEGAPQATILHVIEDVQENDINEALAEVDILPLLADRYFDLSEEVAEHVEQTELDGDAV